MFGSFSKHVRNPHSLASFCSEVPGSVIAVKFRPAIEAPSSLETFS